MARRRTETESLAVVGTLEQFGPLGADNRRRQLGRSEDLIIGRNETATLMQAGAVRAESQGPSLGESLSQSAIITCTKRLIPTTAQIAENPGDIRARIEGVLSWGNDGHQFQARFDWLEGTCVRAVGSYFRLDAHYALELDDAEPNSNVQVGAYIGYGQPLRSATLTRRAVTTLGAPVAAFEVPPFARAFSLWWAGATAVVEFVSGGTVVYTSVLPLGTESKGEALTLPGGVTEVRVNGSTVGPQLIAWHLDI